MDFEILTNLELTFTGDGAEQEVAIRINDNSEYDGNRTFRVTLNLLESDFERIEISPDSIDITIVDDEDPPVAGELCIYVEHMYVHDCVCAYVRACVCV